MLVDELVVRAEDRLLGRKVIIPARSTINRLVRSIASVEGSSSRRPSPKTVARRALVLAAVAMRGYLENEEEGDTPEYLRSVIDWVASHKVDGAFEASERRILRARLGTLGDDRINDALWKS